MEQNSKFISLSDLSDQEALDFMMGWGKLSKPIQSVIMYFLKSNQPFIGTYTALSYALNKNDAYTSEISRVCNWLDDHCILEIQPCGDKKYCKKIEISPLWIKRIIDMSRGKIITTDTINFPSKFGVQD